MSETLTENNGLPVALATLSTESQSNSGKLSFSQSLPAVKVLPTP